MRHAGGAWLQPQQQLRSGPVLVPPPAAHIPQHPSTGGTGITPMLQVADAVLRNPDDKTKA